MNWQTKELSDWLNEEGILNSQRDDMQKLEELVESRLLVQGNLDCTDRIKNLALLLFLKHVQWGQLIHNPKRLDYKEEVS